MSNLTVTALRYELKVRTENEYNFQLCLPIEFIDSDIIFHLEQEVLTIRFLQPPENTIIAISLVQPILRNWETSMNIEYAPDRFNFYYTGASLTDGDPSHHFAELSISADSSVSCVAHIVREIKSYPIPFKSFTNDEVVEHLMDRFNFSLKGYEPIQSMAYYCLDFIEKYILKINHEKRPNNRIERRLKVGMLLRIDPEFLNKLGDYSSDYIDGIVSRKANRFSAEPIKLLSDAERNWIKECIRILIKRIGEYNFDSKNLPEMTKSKLPLT